MNTGGIVALSVFGICLIGLLLVWIIYRKYYRNWVFFQTAMVSLLTIGGMSLIVLFSLQSEESHYWLIPYSFAVSLLLITLIILIIPWTKKSSEPEEQNSWWDSWRQFWNPEKALGGGVFGDFANATGVLSGVGAYQLSDAGEGWFWLGQFAAFLAAIVGLSLALRWIREGDDKSPMGYAVGNYAVGVFTFLAIISSAASSDQSVRILRQMWLHIFQIVILGLMVCIIIGYIWVFKTQASGTRSLHAFIFLWCVVFVLTVGSIVFLRYFWGNLAPNPNWPNLAFSSLAIVSWICIEGIISYRAGTLAQRGRSSLDIIFGNLAMFALVWWIFFESPNQYNFIQWLLFGAAIVLMVHATLGGIVLSAHNVAQRHERAVAVRISLSERRALQYLEERLENHKDVGPIIRARRIEDQEDLN